MILKDSKRFKKIQRDSKRFKKIQKNSKELISKQYFTLKEPATAQKANGHSPPPKPPPPPEESKN